MIHPAPDGLVPSFVYKLGKFFKVTYGVTHLPGHTAAQADLSIMLP